MSDPLHPDLSFLRFVPRTTVGPWTLPAMRALIGLSMRTRLPSGVVCEDRVVPSDGGSVEVRIYRPEGVSGALPVLVWVHGGGLVMGDHREDTLCGDYARDLEIAVVSVNYRLAPEHAFPAAFDDVYSAVRWVQSEPEGARFEGGRVVIGGLSAGGGLAAAAAQRLADEGVSIAGQLLVYPMLDDRTAVRADVGSRDHWIWSNGSNAFGWSSYLGQPAGGEATPPYAVPGRREDLTGVAPAWIGVGTKDLFVDEDRAYAERLKRDGVDCDWHEVAGAVHGFDVLVPKAAMSHDFVASQHAFLRKRLQL